MAKITVNDTEITIISVEERDYISLTEDVRFVNEQVFNFESNLLEAIKTQSIKQKKTILKKNLLKY